MIEHASIILILSIYNGFRESWMIHGIRGSCSFKAWGWDPSLSETQGYYY